MARLKDHADIDAMLSKTWDTAQFHTLLTRTDGKGALEIDRIVGWVRRVATDHPSNESGWMSQPRKGNLSVTPGNDGVVAMSHVCACARKRYSWHMHRLIISFA